MDRASERTQAGALLGAVVLAFGMALPLSAPLASAPVDAVGLFTPGMGCGPSETLVGTGGLLSRVRAEAAAPALRRDAAKAQPRGARQAARRRPPAPLPRSAAGAAPQAEQEPRPAVLRSFYTCDAAPLPNLAEGTGWRLVGPLRRS